MKAPIKFLKQALAFMLIASSLFYMQGCKKTPQVPGTIVGYDNSKKVTASLSGIILDEAGLPIDNATVSIAGVSSKTTDANGYFFFNNVSVPQHNTTVKVSKASYFTGFRSLMIKASQKHTVRLQLMKKENPQTFNASNGGTVSFPGGLDIAFQPNGVVNKATGLLHSGQVFVYAKTIDPTTELGRNTMPGDLRGLTASNVENALESYGMFVAELYDASGNALQVASNSKASISLDIPTSLASSAKANIPLWYFDETKEIWVEEGSATKVGNKYVGEVKHFSFWNCDQASVSVTAEMTLVDQNNNPLAGYKVKMINNATTNYAIGYTNGSGWVGGLVPQNASLTMEVYYDNVLCSTTILHTQTFSTVTSNVNLGTITISVTPATTYTGIVWDCANNPVPNGTAVIQPGNLIVNADAAGVFSVMLPCVPSQPIIVTPYDNAGGVYGTASAPIALIAGANNIGSFSACGNIIPYITVSMTNTFNNTTTNYTFQAPSNMLYRDLSPTISTLGASDSSQTGKYLYLSSIGTTVGTHVISSANINGITNASWTDTQFTLSTAATNTITYTSLPALGGGDALGSYSATFIGSPSGNTYTVTGTFRVP